MTKDFQFALNKFDNNKIWNDTLLSDPKFPVVHARGGWRNMEPENQGAQESWKASLGNLGREIKRRFSDELHWRFANLKNFSWMTLIHPSKFDKGKKMSSKDQRALIKELQYIYPFAVSDITEAEYNHHV